MTCKIGDLYKKARLLHQAKDNAYDLLEKEQLTQNYNEVMREINEAMKALENIF
jgi:hypothetical protein